MILSKMTSAVVDYVRELRIVSVIQHYINGSELLSSAADYVTIQRVLVGVVCGLVLYHVTKKRKNVPPGPRAIRWKSRTYEKYVNCFLIYFVSCFSCFCLIE